MGYSLDLLSLFYYSLKANVLIIDYRGFGSSTGMPSENGLQIDAEAALNYVLKCPLIDHSKIFVYGKSLGAAVALYCTLNHQKQIQGLIMENAFLDVGAMLDGQHPWLAKVKHIILRNYWPNVTRIKNVERPILVVKGENDELLKGKHSEKLFEEATKSLYKEIYMVKDGDHLECYKANPKEYIDRISEFIKSVLDKYPIIN